MIGRVLARNLRQRLQGSTVIDETGALTASGDVQVEVDVRGFETGADGTATLVAQVAIETDRDPARLQDFRLGATPASNDTEATVAALSQTPADGIAAMLAR